MRATAATSPREERRSSIEFDRRCASRSAPDAVVVGSVETTVGDLRRWLDRGEVKVGADRWAGRGDDEPVVLCWYDGPIAKSPPGAPGGTAPPAFNRYATFVDASGDAALVVAGYRDRLAVEAPHA
jgi:hypothetical protein